MVLATNSWWLAVDGGGRQPLPCGGSRDLRGKPSSLLTTGKGSQAARRSCQLNEDLWEGGYGQGEVQGGGQGEENAK